MPAAIRTYGFGKVAHVVRTNGIAKVGEVCDAAATSPACHGFHKGLQPYHHHRWDIHTHQAHVTGSQAWEGRSTCTTTHRILHERVVLPKRIRLVRHVVSEHRRAHETLRLFTPQRRITIATR